MLTLKVKSKIRIAILILFCNSCWLGAVNKDSLCSCYDTAFQWLPEAYLYNAANICKVSPDEKRANEIRVFLIGYFRTHIPDSLAKEAWIKKRGYESKQITRRRYKKYIRKNLVPVIHKAHCMAYLNAGCKADPAPYWQWKYVCTHNVRNKKLAWFCVKTLGGSCSGKVGRW